MSLDDGHNAYEANDPAHENITLDAHRALTLAATWIEREGKCMACSMRAMSALILVGFLTQREGDGSTMTAEEWLTNHFDDVIASYKVAREEAKDAL